MLRAFSERRAQDVEYLERNGSSGFYAAKVAAIETRDRKEPIDLPVLRRVGGARGRARARPPTTQAAAHHARRARTQRGHRRRAHPRTSPGRRGSPRSDRPSPAPTLSWPGRRRSARAPRPSALLELVDRFLGGEQIATVQRSAIGAPLFSTDELLRRERVGLKSPPARRPPPGRPSGQRRLSR